MLLLDASAEGPFVGGDQKVELLRGRSGTIIKLYLARTNYFFSIIVLIGMSRISGCLRGRNFLDPRCFIIAWIRRSPCLSFLLDSLSHCREYSNCSGTTIFSSVYRNIKLESFYIDMSEEDLDSLLLLLFSSLRLTVLQASPEWVERSPHIICSRLLLRHCGPNSGSWGPVPQGQTARYSDRFHLIV